MLHSLRLRLFLVMLLVGVAAVVVALLFATLGARDRLEGYLRQNDIVDLYRAATLYELQTAILPAEEAPLIAADLAALHNVQIERLDPAQAASLSSLLPQGRDVLRLLAAGGAPGMLYPLSRGQDAGEDRVVLTSETPQEPHTWTVLDPSLAPASLQTTTVVRREEEAGGTTTTTEQRAVVQGSSRDAAPAAEQLLLNALNRTFLAALAAALLLAAVLSFLLSRQILRPMARLTGAAQRMALGDLQQRVPVRGHDELAELGSAFNAMSARVEETVTILQKFAADAAHELQTPLTALRTNVELAASEPDPQKRNDFLEQTEAQVARLEQLTRSLLDLSALESGHTGARRETVSLNKLLSDASEPFASRAEHKVIDFVLSLPRETLYVTADPAALSQALGNLLDNALKFTPSGGRIEVSLAAREDMARVTVEDTGPGLDADDLPHLFRRFHRGRNSSALPGSGLGLAIVRATADRHGGAVEAENTTHGARFSFMLPCVMAMTGAEEEETDCRG